MRTQTTLGENSTVRPTDSADNDDHDPLDEWRAAANDPEHEYHLLARADRALHSMTQMAIWEFDDDKSGAPAYARAQARINADAGEHEPIEPPADGGGQEVPA